MASSDATPFPIKNQAYRVTFPILDADGDLVTGAAGLDSEISKDGGTFADVTAEATEIATASGMYYLNLTSTEMNADTVALIIKTTTTGAKTTPVVLYPAEATDIPVNVKAISDDAGAADNLELDYDGTGYTKANSTIGTCTTNTDMRGTDNAALASGVDLTSIHGAALTETVNGYLAAAFVKLFDVTTPLLVASDVMRGTDGANTTTPPTVTAIRQEMDTNSTKMAPSQTLNDYKATGFSTHNAADVWSVAARVLTASTNFNDLTAAEVKAEAVAALADIKLDHLINIAVDTNWATTVHLDSVIGHMADVGTSATFDRTADALEAIRNRGDAAWITATGFNTTTPPTVTQIRQEMDTNSTKMAPSQVLADYKATGFNTVIPDAAGVAPTTAEIKTEVEQAGSTLAQILADTGTDGVLLAATATSAQLVDDIWDELITGAFHNIVNSTGRRLREIGAFAIESGTAQAGTTSTITLAATANGTDGLFNRNLIVLTDNTGKGQTRTIVDYNATSKVVVIDRDWRVTPDATTAYQIVPDDTPLTVDHGVVQAATATTITIRDYASSTDGAYLCNIVAILAGTGRGQARLVGSYDGANRKATLCGDNWVTIPDTTSVYAMMPYGVACAACVGADACDAIADCVLDELTADHTIAGSLSKDISDIKAKTDNLPSGMAKNVAVPKFDVFMVLSSDHVTAATGKTVTGTISKDGGSFVALTNSITEVSGGMYTIASGLTQAERNADVSTLIFTASGCDDRVITIISS